MEAHRGPQVTDSSLIWVSLRLHVNFQECAQCWRLLVPNSIKGLVFGSEKQKPRILGSWTLWAQVVSDGNVAKPCGGVFLLKKVSCPNADVLKGPHIPFSFQEQPRNLICTAKGDDVRMVDVEYLLKQRLRIPIFQRRYCWYEEQWSTLLGDVCLVASGSKSKHALGRITCVLDSSCDGRLLVVDGQQRNTTCTLLLAAVRDVAASRPGEENALNRV